MSFFIGKNTKVIGEEQKKSKLITDLSFKVYEELNEKKKREELESIIRDVAKKNSYRSIIEQKKAVLSIMSDGRNEDEKKVREDR